MQTKKVVILTGNELRHKYVRVALSNMDGIEVVRSYCEGKSITMDHVVDQVKGEKTLQRRHLAARARSEVDFFGAFCALAEDKSNPVFIEGKEINEERHIRDIVDELKPDVLIAYGCSLIRGELLTHFEGRFLNVHLGLSPYYRGAGTNFWPLVNNEPEYVGATFMYIDAGIDTGEIIHQKRAEVYGGDMPHQIGNRLISQIPFIYADLIRNVENLSHMEQPTLNRAEHYYRRKDFSEDNTRRLYENFKNGMVDDYLNDFEARNAKVPIVTHPCVREGI